MQNETIPEIEKKEEPNENYFDFRAFADGLSEGSEKGSNRKEAMECVFDLAAKFKERGGRALLVGGCVRDLYFHSEPKDYDIEVYGLQAEEIEEVAKEFGATKEVGKTFGILKLKAGNIDIDLSLPRKDSKVAEGHKGFKVNTDPFMSIEEAAKRRDFTWNALAADPLTGEVFDHYGGIDDARNKIMKATDPELFKDDPLRVLRGLQFIARFGVTIDEETKQIMKDMIPSLKELKKERFTEEWKKLLLKGRKPSLGLMAGMELGVFNELYPGFPPLTETAQEPEWHPEGDVWMHTLLVTDEAAKIFRESGLDEKDSFSVMLAALCHDIGKPQKTRIEDDRIISPGHEGAGEGPSREFLASINADNTTTEKVIALVTNHMVPGQLYRSLIAGGKVNDSAIRRLADRIAPATIQELVCVSRADSFGRGEFSDDGGFEPMVTEYPAGDWLNRKAELLGIYRKRPEDLVTGKDLLALGANRPKGSEGEKFGKVIELGNRLRNLSELLALEGSDEENINREAYLELLSNEINDLDSAITIANAKGFELVGKIRRLRKEHKQKE